MKKTNLLALLLGVALAPVAMANTISITATTGASGGGGGGEFTAVTVPPALLGLAAPSGPGFQTFCIESDEHINSGGSYNYNFPATVDHDGDQLTRGTAFLFQQFSTGTWSAYNYTLGAGRQQDAAWLQAALWHFQGETIPAGFDVSSANPYIALGNGISNPLGANAGAYPVGIIDVNSVGANGAPTPAQDLLGIIPPTVADGGTTLALLGFALVGIESFRRKVAR